MSHLGTAIAMAEAGFRLVVLPSVSEATCQRYDVRADKIERLVDLSFDCITHGGRGHIELVDEFSQAVAQLAADFIKSMSWSAENLTQEKGNTNVRLTARRTGVRILRRGEGYAGMGQSWLSHAEEH